MNRPEHVESTLRYPTAPIKNHPTPAETKSTYAVSVTAHELVVNRYSPASISRDAWVVPRTASLENGGRVEGGFSMAPAPPDTDDRGPKGRLASGP